MAFCTNCGTNLPDDARFCPACGTATAEPVAPMPEAAFHPAEPAPPAARQALPPLRPHRSGGGGMILPAMIVIALLVIGVFLWSHREGMRAGAGNDAAPIAEATLNAPDEAPAPAAAAPREADGNAARTTVAAIDAAFRADPAGAARRYDGTVTVDGTLVSVSTAGSPSLSLEGATRFNYVVANVAGLAPFAGRAAGDRVTLTCRSVTTLAGTTILQGCAPA